MSSIQLNWKVFPVKTDKINAYLKTHLSSNYDGLLADTERLQVVFKEEYSSEDEAIINSYWDSLNEHSFDPTVAELIQLSLNSAIEFGNSVMTDAMVENIQLGITQAGKTKALSDYCTKLQYYFTTGSLYAAIDELNLLIAAPIPSDLADFVTVERLTVYKHKIQDFLGVSQT